MISIRNTVQFYNKIVTFGHQKAHSKNETHNFALNLTVDYIVLFFQNISLSPLRLWLIPEYIFDISIFDFMTYFTIGFSISNRHVDPTDNGKSHLFDYFDVSGKYKQISFFLGKQFLLLWQARFPTSWL